MGEIFKRNWKKTTGVRPPTDLSDNDILRLAEQTQLTTNATGLAGQPVSSTTPTNGQVLKYSSGQWGPGVDASGSSGGAGGIGVTVAGSGTAEVPSPDFATLREAITAGHRLINVVGDTLETASTLTITSTSGLSIYLHNDTQVNMQTAGIVVATSGRFIISGNGTLRNNGGAGLLTTNASNGQIQNTRLLSEGNAGLALVVSNGSRVEINGCTLQAERMGRVQNSSIGIFNGCILTGESEASEGLLGRTNSIIKITDCVYDGDIGGATNITVGGAETKEVDYSVDGLSLLGAAGTLFMRLGDDSVVSNVKKNRAGGGGTFNFSANGQEINRVHIFNVNLGAANTILPAGRVFDSTADRVISSGNAIRPNSTESRNNTYTNCIIGGGIGVHTITGSSNKYVNCRFNGNTTIDGTGNIVTSCSFNGTLTFLATSSGNMVTSTIVDNTVTDNGNGNVRSALLELNL